LELDQSVDLARCRRITYATILFYHPQENPVVVTTMFNITPTRLLDRSDPRHKLNVWELESRSFIESDRVEDHLRWAAATLIPLASLVRELFSHGWSARISVFLDGEGLAGYQFEIDPDMLQELASLRIELSFDFYFI
jgi:hypothetical protein